MASNDGRTFDLCDDSLRGGRLVHSVDAAIFNDSGIHSANATLVSLLSLAMSHSTSVNSCRNSSSNVLVSILYEPISDLAGLRVQVQSKVRF